MTALAFCKMHGLGNDFVIIDGVSKIVDIKKLPIKELAHRHLGIGFDQLLFIQPSNEADFSCVIFNADGSEAEQCGNGIRCVARFIHENGLSKKTTLRIATKAGIIQAVIHDYDAIEVNMGAPRSSAQQTALFSLDLALVSMGNPHAILRVESINKTPVRDLGVKIATHRELFPQGVNVGFVEIVNSQHIRLRTFERGVGETMACGSNACAAVVAGIRHYSLVSPVKVELELGNLLVAWAGEEKPVMLTGPAVKIFSGMI